jgi:hypothetical protein
MKPNYRIGQLAIDRNFSNLFDIDQTKHMVKNIAPTKIKEKQELIKIYLQNERIHDSAIDQWINDPVTISQIEYCIRHRLPVVVIAYTQSGKTFIKINMIKKGLSLGWFDSAVVSTVPYTQAYNQLHSRLFNEFPFNQVVGAQSLDPNVATKTRLLPGQIISSMTDKHRLKPLLSALDIYNQSKSKCTQVGMFLDESHLNESAQGDTTSKSYSGNIGDGYLYELVTRYDILLVCRVSATMLGSLVASQFFTHQNGYMHIEQILQPPLNPNYHGIPTDGINFEFKSVFQDETKYGTNGKPLPTKQQIFSRDTYKDNATLKNTKNIGILADEMIAMSARRPFNDIPDIGTVVMGVSRNGHKKVIELLDRALTSRGEVVETWSDSLDSISSLIPNATVVLVEQNGDSDPSLVSTKLWELSTMYPRGQLKHIVFVSKKMLGLSVTVEATNPIDPSDRSFSTDPNHHAFGWYCNWTAYYAPAQSARDTAIQAMRCTGNRIIGLKEHTCFMTPEEAEGCISYYDIDMFGNHGFITELKRTGKFDTTTMIEWSQSNSKKKTSRAPLQALLPKDSNGKRKKTAVSSSTIANSAMARYTVTKEEWNYYQPLLPKDLYNEMLSLGFKSTIKNPKLKVNRNGFKDEGAARLGMRSGSKSTGNNYFDVSITLSTDGNGNYSVICVDTDLINDSSKDHVFFDFEMKGQAPNGQYAVIDLNKANILQKINSNELVFEPNR